MSDKSLIEIFAAEVQKPGGHRAAPILYRMVAEDVRARFNPEDAAVVAAWFERLAAGEDPRKVFVTKSRGGRPRKEEKAAANDYDIAWIVHLAIKRQVAKPAEVYKRVGKAH